jgi:hypothetical protein
MSQPQESTSPKTLSIGFQLTGQSNWSIWLKSMTNLLQHEKLLTTAMNSDGI